MKPTNANKGHRRCARLVNVPGKITPGGVAGTNRFTFRGRIGGRRLGPGSYRLTAARRANQQAGKSRTIAFKIAA